MKVYYKKYYLNTVFYCQVSTQMLIFKVFHNHHPHFNNVMLGFIKSLD